MTSRLEIARGIEDTLVFDIIAAIIMTCVRISGLLLILAFGCKTQAETVAATQAIGILESRCGQCHSDKAAMSGFRISSRDAILKGGSRGAAIQPGHAADSLLYQAVAHIGKLTMPPGPKLADSEIKLIQEWIDQGAGWPENASTAKRVEWWAFQKPHRPDVPQVNAAGSAIDSFLLAKLRAEQIEPAPEASRLALLRRATFDLLGLPPTPDQVRAFLADTRPDAWERLIDTLLASPKYGEKWGRFWLDLVRYGDTSGFEQDPYLLEAWRYRDWVIKSLNDDKPYDRFAKEQIAGDEFWPDEVDARTGTGYYRVGVNRDLLFKVEDQNRAEKLTDYVGTTSEVFLGLTVGCARCHDHKFDPIPQRDFYRMQAIFAPLVYDRIFLEYNAGRNYDLSQNGREFKLRQIGEQITRLERPYRQQIKARKMAALPEADRAILELKPEKRTPQQQATATPLEEKVSVTGDEVRAAMSQDDTERLHGIEKRLVSMFAGYGPPPMTPGVMDGGREAPRTFVALRGNPASYGEEVGPGFLSALGGGDVPEPPLHAETTGRRKALATWMASPDNPLFARVMVNRIWQGHFGAGLVRTPSDFGVRAGTPGNRDLLDWLAVEFAERKWSLKAMHKLIMTSAAYRRSADPTVSAREKDPANELFSHMSRRRLQSEEIHDAVLQASGSLNLKVGGTPVVPSLQAEELYGLIGKPENNWVVTPDAEEHNRRSIYMLQRRTFQQPMFEAFDSPDGVLSCPRRNESTTAPQSLALLNGDFMMKQAKKLAAKVHDVDEAWLMVLGRAPSSEERASARGFIERQAQRLGSKEAAYTELARALMNLNEFLYVE
jgi:hypothetical protein